MTVWVRVPLSPRMNEIKAKLTILCQVVLCNELAKLQRAAFCDAGGGIKRDLVVINTCEKHEFTLIEMIEVEPKDTKTSC